ncbi:MAG: phosphotransferase [Bacteroidales bacterium]|nr:phosphotransferase [Bacteroidales bacterium]
MSPEISIKRVGDRIFITGALCAENISEVIAELNDNHPYTLDFDGVSDMDFSSLRALLNHRQRGNLFYVANVSPAVAHRFSGTGADKFISVTERPIEVDMDDYEYFGDGYTALSYNHRSGQQVLKLYHDFMPQDVVEKEKRTAVSALLMGIPTPMTGPIVRIGKRHGIIFERIANKKSFVRAIADAPEKLEYYAITFADMCKRLHDTPCDTSVFPSIREFYRDLVTRTPHFSEDEKQRFAAFLETVDEKNTCIHGDLHIGNVITTGEVNLFIDMADFGYGDPLFDLGLLYYMSHSESPERTMRLFHIDDATFLNFWHIFLRRYFNTNDASELAGIEARIKPFAALKMIHFGELSQHMSDWQKSFVRREL